MEGTVLFHQYQNQISKTPQYRQVMQNQDIGDSSHTELIDSPQQPNIVPATRRYNTRSSNKMAEQLSSKREAASSKVRKEYYSSKKKQRRSDVALTLGENEALKTIQEGKTGEIQFVALSDPRIDGVGFFRRIDVKKITNVRIDRANLQSLVGFENVHFSVLEYMELNSCNLQDPSGLELSNFPNLHTLNLTNNLLRNLYFLSDPSPTLTQLYVQSNRLTSLQSLPSANLGNLKLLSLANNLIESLLPLRKTNLTLRSLHLGHNRISNIDCLDKVDLGSLKSLFLDNNLIGSLEVLARMQMGGLKLMDVSNNCITDLKVLLRVRAFRHVYLMDNQDFFPGIYVAGNPVVERYWTQLFKVSDGDVNMRYFMGEDNMDYEYLEMNYAREGESQLEGQGEEGEGQEGEEGQGQEGEDEHMEEQEDQQQEEQDPRRRRRQGRH